MQFEAAASWRFIFHSVDAACCYRRSGVVCLCAGYDRREPSAHRKRLKRSRCRLPLLQRFADKRVAARWLVAGVPGHRAVREAAVSDGADTDAARSGVRLHGRGEGRRQLVPVRRVVCVRQRRRQGRTRRAEERCADNAVAGPYLMGRVTDSTPPPEMLRRKFLAMFFTYCSGCGMTNIAD